MLYSLALAESEHNDAVRLYACYSAANATPAEELTVRDSPFFKNDYVFEAKGPEYNPLVVNPLMPSAELWVDVVLTGLGLASLPDNLRALVECLRNAAPPKADAPCPLPVDERNSMDGDRTALARRVCLRYLAELVAKHGGCATPRDLFQKLFDEPGLGMGEGFSGFLARSAVSLERLVQDFMRLDTYSKALLMVEVFSAQLDEGDLPLRLAVVDVLSPHFCKMSRRVVLSRRLREKRTLVADADVQVVCVERAMSKFLWPATRVFEPATRVFEPADEEAKSSPAKEIHSILNAGKGHKTKSVTVASAADASCVFVSDFPVRTDFKVEHYLSFPAFASEDRKPLFFLTPKRHVVARILLPGLFRRESQFYHGTCLNSKEWTYHLADYSPVRSPPLVAASKYCASTASRRHVARPYYF